ncbi:HAD family hydrolase [Chlorobium sp. N1]|uniref:D-glycero-alpha-D-manno-heptose-1,7-bisphosphate 7-phosphatase n=1 Tax=Chlorobium sp. N1 TaxID=2491138 RepID=UPI00103BAB48|nr:HAD family hydrolase [Chlorobium sp. N1]TCD47801.1 HAD family hydrolase [Chlorobium sp. N1]
MAETVRVLFLDRDGTINEDIGSYVATRPQLKLIDRAAEAVALAREAGFRIVIITNQAGIARGIATVEQVEDVNHYLNELLREAGGFYDRCYYCPSHPEHPHPEYDRFAGCRKPETGMVERAIADFRAEGLAVDRGNSFFIGDKMIDVECGLRASLRPILVRTGHDEEEVCRRKGIMPEFVADDLYAAVTGYILR